MCCFHAESPYTVRRSSVNVIQWPVCIFSLLKSKQIKTHVAIPTVGIKRFESPFEISVVIKRPLWYLNSIFSCSFIWNKKKLVVFASGAYEIKKIKIIKLNNEIKINNEIKNDTFQNYFDKSASLGFDYYKF